MHKLTVLVTGTVGSCPGLGTKARVPPVVIATECVYPAYCVCARISVWENTNKKFNVVQSTAFMVTSNNFAGPHAAITMLTELEVCRNRPCEGMTLRCRFSSIFNTHNAVTWTHWSSSCLRTLDRSHICSQAPDQCRFRSHRDQGHTNPRRILSNGRSQ